MTKLPPTVVTVGSLGTTNLAADCIEVVLRARPGNTAAVMVNLFTTGGGVGDEPGGDDSNAIWLDPGNWVRLPAHGNTSVKHVKETGASDQNLEIIEILQG